MAAGEDWLVAARHFERAAAADSTFARARLWAAQIHMLAGGYNNDWPGVAKAESLLAPLVEAPRRLSRYDRCRLDFVRAVTPPRHVPSMYEATRCMVEAAPGSEDARGELAVNALRVNRPREALALWRNSQILRKRPGHWTTRATAYHMLGDYRRELDVSRQGLERYPQHLLMMLGEARALAALGRSEEATDIADQMRALPSREGTAGWVGLVADELRAHDHRDAARAALREAIAWFRSRLLDMEGARAGLAGLLYRAGQWDEALPLYAALAEEYPENTAHLAALGRVAARRGDREEATRVSEDLRSSRHALMEGYRTLERARIAALLGDVERAMALLRQSFDYGANWARWPLLHSDMDFEVLHDHPPFREFLRPKG